MNDTSKKLPGCDEFDPALLSVDNAKKNIIASVSALHDEETLSIRDALMRIVARDIKSTINVPSHTNSAMDGYALRGTDIPSEGSADFVVAGKVLAGAPLSITIKPGQCARIMTGGKMPDGTDTVIMQEHVTVSGNNISVTAGHKPGQNVRQAGEDLAIGDIVIQKGKQLTPADIGMLASIGEANVAVYRKLRVAFFSTGDELCSVGKPLAEGQIYDSNRYTLFAMLKRLGVDIIDMGVVPDQRDQVENAFLEAAKQADVLITSGGVSVGEADYVKETLEKLGEVGFWKIAMKPGKPLAFGFLKEDGNECVFFGLPGNPVSAMVTFYQFVQPALQKMMGTRETEPLLVNVMCVSSLKKVPGRLEYQRGVLFNDDDGNTVVKTTGGQGSGILSSMGNANCFIVLPPESTGTSAGDMVTVQPFAGLI